jgi:hypothetical protein
MLILPKTTVIGDIIAYTNYKLTTKEGRRNRYTFAGAEYFKRMQELDLYVTDREAIENRINQLSLKDIMNQKLI